MELILGTHELTLKDLLLVRSQQKTWIFLHLDDQNSTFHFSRHIIGSVENWVPTLITFGPNASIIFGMYSRKTGSFDI